MNVEETIRSHQGWFIGKARRLRTNWHSVEDLAQIGAIGMFEASQSWDGRGDQLGWMRKISIWRMQREAFPPSDRKQPADLREYAADFADPDSTFWGSTESHDNYYLLSYHTPQIIEALNSLPERQRKYVTRKFWDEADNTTLSAEFSRHHLSTLWRGAKMNLRKKLAHLEEMA